MKHSKRKLRTLRKLIIVNLTLLILSLIWLHKDNGRPIAIAIAKSGQIYQMAHTLPITNIDYAQIEQQLHQNAQLSQLLTSKQTDFLNAIPLSEGEARYWQTEGCAQYNCLHLTFINYSDGGTIEAIVQSESESVIAHWQNLQARPAGSQHIVSKAIEIAAADSQVHAILGDIGDADPAMIPMSGWLMDDDCQSDWCVDLTYHDPNGTGRIFHARFGL